jgi:hypothetical protein
MILGAARIIPRGSILVKDLVNFLQFLQEIFDGTSRRKRGTFAWIVPAYRFQSHGCTGFPAWAGAG